MNTTCSITKDISIRSEDPGNISVIIGTDGRVVKASLLQNAVQNAMNTGFKIDPLIEAKTTIYESEDKSRFVTVINSTESLKDVILQFDSEKSSSTVGRDVLQAISRCS